MKAKIIALFLLLFFMAGTANAAISCRTALLNTACNAPTEIEVLRLSGTTNAHAATPTGSNFTNSYRVCCSGGITSASSGIPCPAGQKILGLSDATNAHAEEPGGSVYTLPSMPTATYICGVGLTGVLVETGSCNANEGCVAVLSYTTNAHLKSCDAAPADPNYTKAICITDAPISLPNASITSTTISPNSYCQTDPVRANFRVTVRVTNTEASAFNNGSLEVSCLTSDGYLCLGVSPNPMSQQVNLEANNASGTVTFTFDFSGSQIAGLPAGDYTFKAELKNSSGITVSNRTTTLKIEATCTGPGTGLLKLESVTVSNPSYFENNLAINISVVVRNLTAIAAPKEERAKANLAEKDGTILLAPQTGEVEVILGSNTKTETRAFADRLTAVALGYSNADVAGLTPGVYTLVINLKIAGIVVDSKTATFALVNKTRALSVPETNFSGALAALAGVFLVVFVLGKKSR